MMKRTGCLLVLILCKVQQEIKRRRMCDAAAICSDRGCVTVFHFIVINFL